MGERVLATRCDTSKELGALGHMHEPVQALIKGWGQHQHTANLPLDVCKQASLVLYSPEGTEWLSIAGPCPKWAEFLGTHIKRGLGCRYLKPCNTFSPLPRSD